MRLLVAVALILAFGATPAAASTFAPVTKKCPVGGEKFKFMELMSISTYGQMPDGMPIGSGVFPTALPQCPKNGLVMYRDFDAAAVARLTPIVASEAYQAMRSTETPYYLAYRLATELGDESAVWLLLSATWEAKAAGVTPQATRYMEEFVSLTGKMPVDAKSFDSIVARTRAADTLRELGRFADAETLRASITIAPDAGGADAEAGENRAGWAKVIASLQAPIARGDASRAPIDLIGNREASFRCVAPDIKPEGEEKPAPPLTAFETDYCARPEMAKAVVELRGRLGDRLAH